jgi:hypothetical protein
MYQYYIEPNGDLVRNDSRRQDQYEAAAKPSTLLYLQYRYMAVHEKNKLFAAICKQIETTKDFEKDILTRSLFYFLEDETLQEQLPTAEVIFNITFITHQRKEYNVYVVWWNRSAFAHCIGPFELT